MGLSDATSRTSEPFSEMEFLGKARGKPLLRSKLHQPTLERHLQEGLKRFPNVTVLHGLEATAIETNAEGVRIRAVRTDGSEIEVSARYLIGSDGGPSSMRPGSSSTRKRAAAARTPNYQRFISRFATPGSPSPMCPWPAPITSGVHGDGREKRPTRGDRSRRCT